MTRPWFLRRLVGDARRHLGVWLALGVAFAAVGFCAAGARLVDADRAAGAARGPEAAARVIAYLADDLAEGERTQLLGVLARLPGVEQVTLVAPKEGLERLRRELGARAALLEGVGPDLLFTSIEIAARPEAASALAFRLRRLHGIADVDLVPSPTVGTPAPPPVRGALARVRAALRRAGPLASAAVVALLALGAALALLRARLKPELGVLMTLGVTRASGARPTLTLATAAGGLGGVLGVLVASGGARVWLGTPGLPAREAALGAVALVLLAFAAASGAMRGREGKLTAMTP